MSKRSELSKRSEWQSGVASLQAFMQQFESAAPALYAWASLHIRGTLRRSIDPEDLLQEVCCRSFVRFGDYDLKRGSFRGWLFGFAHNVLREALRSVRTRGESVFVRSADSNPRGFDQIADDATAISQRVSREEALQSFLDRVETLPDDDRRLLLYRGIEGRSHAEVATLFDTTPAIVEKRWQRLRNRVRRWKTPVAILVDGEHA